MKKIFFTIYFLALILPFQSLRAEIVSVQNAGENPKSLPPIRTDNGVVPGMPDPNDEDAIRNFFKKRLNEAARTPIGKDIDWNNSSSSNIIHSKEYYENKTESEKSTFEKIYEETLNALKQKENATDDTSLEQTQNPEQLAQTATRFFTIAPKQNAEPIAEPEIPTVSLSLPSGRKILAPADEHIPYFLSYIDIQANGYLKIEDTVTIVANSQKFAYGLRRVFPKYSHNQQNQRKRIELILTSVTVNDVEIPYVTEEIGNNLVIRPKFNQKLETGVYTYKFNYLINRKLERDDNIVYLDWNVIGSPINALITSANAIITLPDGYSFKDAISLVGYNKKYTERRTNKFSLAKNVIAFSNTTPLLNNEEMNIIAAMNPNVFIKDFDKNYSGFFTDWGNIIYAFLGFITILSSFLLSLFSLKKEQQKNKYKPSYNGSMLRSILIGKFDRLAFVAKLLELYRKDAIDINIENNRAFIIKKNIQSSRLTANERKATKALFPKKSERTEINNTNTLILKKVKHIFEKSYNKQIKKYRLMHNIGYVLFSIAILITTEVYIALIGINFAQNFIIMLTASVLYAFYIWILRHKFKHILISLPIKLFSLLVIAVIVFFTSIYIGAITSLLIIAMIYTIFEFSRIFNEHNNFINEAKSAIDKFKEYLLSNAESINLSRDFLNQQSNIFALDITEYFPQNVSNKNYYKLDAAETIKQMLIGII